MATSLGSTGTTLDSSYTARFFSALRRLHYEYRMFFSLAIAGGITSVAVWKGHPAPGTTGELSDAYLVAALLLVGASILRMWAGSQLTSDRVMSFSVQPDKLITSGPYRIVRNPIYLADILAMLGVAAALSDVSQSVAVFLLPLLFTLHYLLLIRYEEFFLQLKHGSEFTGFTLRVPRLFPIWRSNVQPIVDEEPRVFINYDGARNNALYTLFILGFVVASVTHVFWHAVVIGAPALIDWVIIHTRKGIRPELRDLPATDTGRTPKESVGTVDTSSIVFDDVLYASCWEDPALDRAAFASSELPLAGSTIFTITSGGCNALTFLLDDPERVIALDLNVHQNHLLELKIAAFRRLQHNVLLDFFGVPLHSGPSALDRCNLYRRELRWHMSVEAAAYWDAHEEAIRDGILHAGRFERYMRLLRRTLRLLLGKRTIAWMFEGESNDADDVRKRAEYFDRHWMTMRWRLFRRVLLSRWLMSKLFDPAFFAQLDADNSRSGRFSFGRHFEARLRFGFTGSDRSNDTTNAETRLVAPRENPFLNYILFGTYSHSALPDYLRPEHFQTIRSRVGRIRLEGMPCEEYLDHAAEGSITHFNFTNIFEWMPTDAFERLLRATARAGKNGSVVTYRNLLVPRSRPDALATLLVPDDLLADTLAGQDRSFIYRAYRVERVVKSERP